MDCLVVTPHRYGIAEVAERVGHEWAASGHDVDYLMPRGEAARVGPITVGVPGIALWWRRTLQRLARESTHDLVWLHQPVAPTLPTRDPAFWRRAVVTFHTTERAEYRLARDGVYPRRRLPYLWFTSRLEARFYRKLAALGDDGPRFTAVAPHIADEASALGAEDASVIPNGVFNPGSVDPAGIRAEHGIPEDATLVFNVASLTPQKRPGVFAATMRRVVDDAASGTDGDPIYCVMAGKGPLQDAVERHTGDRLIAPGYVSDDEKWRWFAAADVFASLSAYEGMPMAAAEALSFDLPLVLSDVPAHRWLAERPGVEARLVGDDADGLRRAIAAVADEQSDAELPSWRAVAERYIEIGPGGIG